LEGCYGNKEERPEGKKMKRNHIPQSVGYSLGLAWLKKKWLAA